MEIKTLGHKGLDKAKEGSYYFIAGAGGDLQEWIDGYNGLLKEAEIGEPVQWFRTSGASVNTFALLGGHFVHPKDLFQDDLTCLLFPLDGLNLGKLAIFKLKMQDRWFDDVIINMRNS